MGSNVLMQKLVFVAQLASQAVLYVLLALSVLSIGVIIERWWYFRRRRDNLDTLADRLRRPEFSAVWQIFYESFHTDFLPADAQELVRSTCRPRQQVVLGYWLQILDTPVAALTGLITDATAALRTEGVPYVYVAGGEPAPEYRQWLGEQLPAAAIEVWPRSGHFPHLARPQQFALQLAATAQWARHDPTPMESA